MFASHRYNWHADPMFVHKNWDGALHLTTIVVMVLWSIITEEHQFCQTSTEPNFSLWGLHRSLEIETLHSCLTSGDPINVPAEYNGTYKKNGRLLWIFWKIDKRFIFKVHLGPIIYCKHVQHFGRIKELTQHVVKHVQLLALKMLNL